MTKYVQAVISTNARARHASQARMRGRSLTELSSYSVRVLNSYSEEAGFKFRQGYHLSSRIFIVFPFIPPPTWTPANYLYHVALHPAWGG
jgi:hypothetical protein